MQVLMELRSFTAIHRSQWLGYQSSFGDGGAPTTQMVSFNTPIYKLRSGFGAYIVNDKLGPQNNLEAQAMYAYHLGIKETKLSFGVKAGYVFADCQWKILPVHSEGRSADC